MNRPFFLLLFSVVASAQQYVVSTLAGGVPPVTPADPAGVSIGDPPRVAVDAAGNTYFGSLHSIFKIDTAGSLVRIAGAGRAGISGDGGPATAAQVSSPVGIVVSPAGAVYYTERNLNLIRAISPDGTISTLPVTGLSGPFGLALDRAGNLYVSDTGSNTVRKIDSTGAMTTVAGNGAPGYSGDGGPAVSASLNGPEGLAVDAAGNLYIADTFNNRVRVVGAGGVISTFAGDGLPGLTDDGEKATTAHVILPTDVAVDTAGAVYIADLGNSRIRKVSQNVISTIAGNNDGAAPIEGMKAISARLSGPTGVAVDASGAVYIAEGSIGSGTGLAAGVFKIWKVTPDGTLSTLAGTGLNSFSGDGGAAGVAQFDMPTGVARDTRGNLYIADTRNNRIRMIAPDGTITTVAGNALPGFSGESGPATLAQLNHPTGVAVDPAGNLYIADTGNNRVRMVFPNGIIGTLAGNGNTAFFGDGGNSAQAALNHPEGVAIDAAGTIYIADTGNHCIRRVGSAVITTPVQGLNAPSSVAVDDTGSIYVADRGAGTVQKFFEGGSFLAPLPGARGVAIDSFGNVYATGGGRIVQVGNNGSLTTIAGTGQCCYSGDGGPAGAARFDTPWGIAADGKGNLYIADSAANAIRVATAGASTFYIRSIANGASNQVGSLAPGEIVTIYGAGLGPQDLLVASQAAAGTVLPNNLGGTTVLFNQIPAPLFYVSAGQVSAIVPYGVTGSTVQVVVRVGNATTTPFALPFANSAPGLFTADSSGGGPARAINADGIANNAAHPAIVGSKLTLYVTGEGQTSPPGVDGQPAGATPPQPVLPVAVTIGGKSATVLSAAQIPGGPAGVMQVSVTVPAGLTGQQPVAVTVGNTATQSGITVAVQ